MSRNDSQFSPQMQRFMKALASQTRQDVMFLFNDREELTVGDVAERLSLAQSAASVHLSTLREASILTSRKEWKTVYYQVNPDGIFTSLNELHDYLMACCPPRTQQPEVANDHETNSCSCNG